MRIQRVFDDLGDVRVQAHIKHHLVDNFWIDNIVQC